MLGCWCELFGQGRGATTITYELVLLVRISKSSSRKTEQGKHRTFSIETPKRRRRGFHTRGRGRVERTVHAFASRDSS